MALTKVTGAGIGTVTNQFVDANMASGSVLQVVSNHITSQHSTSTTGEEDITDMNVTITPSSTSSKILILVQMIVGSGQDTGNHYTLKEVQLLLVWEAQMEVEHK